MLKIGVFDSGLGGLTVVKALCEVIQNAQIFYVADTKHAPYGEKTPQQILQYSLNITQYLLDTHQIDVLIIACNTATSAAIKTVRERYPLLMIIGTEPGIKPAIEQTHTGKIGILATPATLSGDKYQSLANALVSQKDVTLFEQACPGLVEQIEKGEISTQETKMLLEKWVLPMKENRVDTIVLGCTHYPLVGEIISEIMLCDVKLIETGAAIAKRVLDLSLQRGHINQGSCNIFIESTGKIYKEMISALFGEEIEVNDIDIV
ncbi:Glutamate racemase [hydrothermal vent metagenome]|uniref:glutamate racemase n=1 Tax=hydrothermal vent metagenome TaxID=652676 RepID=A0A1W1CUP1_9ZZZZ